MKSMFFITVAVFMSATMASAYSYTSPNATCFGQGFCKIVLDEPTTEEALAVLAGDADISESLRQVIENQRSLVSQKVGAEKAESMTDADLLKLIVAQ